MNYLDNYEKRIIELTQEVSDLEVSDTPDKSLFLRKKKLLNKYISKKRLLLDENIILVTVKIKTQNQSRIKHLGMLDNLISLTNNIADSD